ncbi:DUF602-domain-containing protein [Violaceomyces palustris]|uniref:DUF602-domain-containing protein n=1 Tax=Violaceomyces palustris TaxID=1673888 RepID=A0ACD0P3I2_9BASI|nr:DUF602-domain-containing protein [Violaceomyces palustris]
MGNDGGSIARRDDLVRTKAMPEKADRENVRKALWSLCRLSRQPLRQPIVSDSLGRLYNKDSVVQYLLNKVDKERRKSSEELEAAHIRGLKDVRELCLTRNRNYKPPSPTSISNEITSSPFLCPLTQKEMNGKYRFVYLVPCGCVFSESGLRAISSEVISATVPPAMPASSTDSKSSKEDEKQEPEAADARPCPQCGTVYRANSMAKGKEAEAGGDVVMLNPSDMEEKAMRAAMEVNRSKEAIRKKKSKAEASTTSESNGDGGNGTSEAEQESKRKRKAEKKAIKHAAAAALAAELASENHPESLGGGGKRLKVSDQPSMSSFAPGVSAARSVAAAQANAMAREKEKKPMSPAIASIYGHGKAKTQGDSWLTRGTFTRYA